MTQDTMTQTSSSSSPKKSGPWCLQGALLAAVIIVLDQLTKWAVFERVLRHDGQGPGFGEWLITRIHADEIYARGEAVYHNIIITPFLNMVMVWNKGVSFGLFAADGAINKYGLVFVAILISIGMGIGLYRTQKRLMAAACAVIIGGAIGNVIDRLRFGAVADFVDVHVMGHHWPAFNLADSAIVIGAGLMILDAFLTPDSAGQEKNT